MMRTVGYRFYCMFGTLGVMHSEYIHDDQSVPTHVKSTMWVFPPYWFVV